MLSSSSLGTCVDMRTVLWHRSLSQLWEVTFDAIHQSWSWGLDLRKIFRAWMDWVLPRTPMLISMSPSIHQCTHALIFASAESPCGCRLHCRTLFCSSGRGSEILIFVQRVSIHGPTDITSVLVGATHESAGASILLKHLQEFVIFYLVYFVFCQLLKRYVK
jgi:hypothetical protein